MISVINNSEFFINIISKKEKILVFMEDLCLKIVKKILNLWDYQED